MTKMRKTPKMIEIEDRIEEPVEDFLRREYVDRKKSLYEIAESLGEKPQLIHKWMKKANIHTRSISEAQGIVHQKRRNRPSKEELHQLYVTEGLAAEAIGEKYGVHKATIYTWIRKDGLQGLRARETGKKKKDKESSS
jgi:uncharacterized protein YjcR